MLYKINAIGFQSGGPESTLGGLLRRYIKHKALFIALFNSYKCLDIKRYVLLMFLIKVTVMLSGMACPWVCKG